MAKNLNLLESDLYQNGSVFTLEQGKEVLLRERLPSGGQSGDSTANPIVGQDIRLLAFNRWRGLVERADCWWWLLADRNNVYNPLFNARVDSEGNVVDVMAEPILVPNILRQKAKF